MTTAPFWVSASLDLPVEGFEGAAGFWQGVTGYSLSERRAGDGELATLVAPDGDDYLRLRRVVESPGLHLDLHVDSPTMSAEAAVELGAHVLLRHEQGYVVARSPGGLRFRLVRRQAALRPRPATWADGHRSQVDQVCLDLPPEAYDADVEFWQGLTGWDLTPSVSREFARLEPPDTMPLRWLIQRLDTPGGPVRAHLDLACDDRDAEIARHEELGASVVAGHDHWTVLTDPVGTTYCITGRTPR